jgi:hypothetical protein
MFPGANRRIRGFPRARSLELRSRGGDQTRARARARGIAERGCVGVPLGVPLAEGGRTPKIRTKRGYRPNFFFPRWWGLYVAGTYFK